MGCAERRWASREMHDKGRQPRHEEGVERGRTRGLREGEGQLHRGPHRSEELANGHVLDAGLEVCHERVETEG